MHKAMSLPRKCFNLVINYTVCFQFLSQHGYLVHKKKKDESWHALVCTVNRVPDCWIDSRFLASDELQSRVRLVAHQLTEVPTLCLGLRPSKSKVHWAWWWTFLALAERQRQADLCLRPAWSLSWDLSLKRMDVCIKPARCSPLQHQAGQAFGTTALLTV